MSPARKSAAALFALCAVAPATLGSTAARAFEPPTAIQQAQNPAPIRFGGTYSELPARQQKLVAGWVVRFNELTGERIEAGAFYDTKVKLSTKTTFEAVTNALMTTALTDASGGSYGDALDLVEEVEAVRGQTLGASGDHQFRMYARLTEGALDRLNRSQQFRRAGDNTIFHKGYPTNYRQQGGTPSIQFSVATDGRRADIDVDYRSPTFPLALFNGHLTAANSDVRAGNNYGRHTNRWAGFGNWWQSIFGVRMSAPSDAQGKETGLIPLTPRAGKKDIDVMVDDFLRAWLVDGDIPAAMGYVSERSYACLAQEGDDRSAFDLGLAPVQLMLNLKAAHEALGSRDSLEGLVTGVRLTRPGLKVVTQPHHQQFVIYAVPDDVAAAFDCESRLTLGDPKKERRAYGRYFGAVFFIDGQKDYSLALLWAKENGYWKIVSWLAEPIDDDEGAQAKDDTPAMPTPAVPSGASARADAALVESAKGFLESWLIRKDYDAAFKYLSPASYPCYNLGRSSEAPEAASPADAAPLIRAALERAGAQVGRQARLDNFLFAVVPFHPDVRILSHRYSRTFTLTSVPSALASAVDCAARARGDEFSGEIRPEYGQAYGMNVRFGTRSGETPVLRTLWIKEAGAWRISMYDVDYP